MSRQRRNFSGSEKMSILREHLIEHIPVSDIWRQARHSADAFLPLAKEIVRGRGRCPLIDRRNNPPVRSRADAAKIEKLEAKLQQKNEVLGELMGEHIALKKSLGEI